MNVARRPGLDVHFFHHKEFLTARGGMVVYFCFDTAWVRSGGVPRRRQRAISLNRNCLKGRPAKVP